MKNKIYLLIGGNIGNRSKNLQLTRELINGIIGPIIKLSLVYETKPWGNTDQPDFLNQVLFIQTEHSAETCMEKIFEIEHTLKRIRTNKNAPRTIDIDILFFNEDIINKPALTIPHPEIQNRKFVLIPMNEIFPELIHPVLKKSIRTLLSECTDKLEVNLPATLN